MKRCFLLVTVISLGLALLPGSGQGQTLELKRRWSGRRPITIRPGRGGVKPIELKRLAVTATVENQVSRTQIDQTFHNPNSWQAEGTYLFPLPAGTSVSSFSMYMGGKEIKGEVLDRDKASQIYQSIVRRRQDPGLLEFVGHQLIRARVFPIPANGDVRIKLQFSRVLTADAGWFEYSYPLSSAGKRIKQVSFDLTLVSKIPIKTVYSPTHRVQVRRTSDRKVRVKYEKTGLKAERGFSLLFGLSKKDLGLHLLTHRKQGEDGYFMLAISPKVELKQSEILPKSIVFVIDTSGSMSGEKIQQAREALKYCINSLKPNSHFNIVRFSTEVDSLAAQMLPVNKQTRKKALAFIDDLEAVGGTNIDEALAQALALAGKRDGLVEIVFLTDGKPTIGERKTSRILKKVASLNKTRARLFVFGIGENLNTHLLDKLAESNQGLRTYVTSGESIERKVSSFYAKISSPVLSHLTLALGQLRTKDIFPRRLPDLFRGGQLLVFGRYKNAGNEPITLAGKVASTGKQFVYEADFPQLNEKNDFLPRLWAQRKVGYLLDSIRLHGQNPELKLEIIRLAKRYQIVTPYTSALVLEDGASSSPKPTSALTRRGGGRLGGFRGRPGKGGGSAQPPRKPAASSGASQLRKKEGKKAVELSRKLSKMKQSDSLEEDEKQDGKRRQAIKKVGAKTFVQLKDGTWIESGLAGKGKEKTKKLAGATEVVYLSKAYFALLKQHPGIGRYLKVGKKLTFEFKGVIYRIAPEVEKPKGGK